LKKINLFFIVIVFFACSEFELERANPIENLELSTGNVQEIGTFSCKVQGTIITNEFNGVDNYGHCWSLQNNPTINDASNEFGFYKGEKSFVSNLNDLAVNTTYYLRAYAMVNDTIIYGDNINIFTEWNGDTPLIKTGDAGSITSSQATLIGIILEQGQSSVTKYGHCWSSQNNPTIDDLKTENIGGSAVDTFSTTLINLLEDEKYYYRAYAENEQGLAYGPEKSFSTTDGRPSVNTTEVIEIKSTSAISEGKITGIGDAPITKHGHCWSTSPLPTINDLKTENIGGSSGLIFNSNLTNLSPVTDYYVRSYAENSLGISYGNEIAFSTNNGLALVTTGSYDINGSNVDLYAQIIGIGNGIIEHGHYWSTSSGVSSINYDDKSELGVENNTVSFTTSDINLNPNTTYYYKAYAVTDAGTVTGNEQVLSTGSPWTNIGQLTGITDNNNAMLVLSSNNVWVVGSDIWNWDGFTWINKSNPSDYDIVAIDGTSSNNIWIVDDNDVVWWFNGTTWTSFTGASDEISNVKDILVSSNRIVIGGTENFGPGIRISTNNGLSWILEYPTCSSNCHGFVDMDDDTNNNIWVGSGSFAFMGTQGTSIFNGVSWSTNSLLYNIKCLSAVNSNTAFATSAPNSGSWNPLIWKNENGVWNSIDLPSGIQANSGYTPIDAISSNHVWFGSDKIYKYNGSSWIEETGSIGDNIKIIQMLNTNEGFAVTGNGTILKRQ
jgi:hypothetical protein